MSTKPTDDGDAHQPTPTAQRSDGGGPEIPNPRVNRREMLKITGATGAATVGLSGAGPASITGDSEAIAPIVAGAPAFAAAAGAGHYLANYDIDGDTDLDEDDVLEDHIYEVAASVADGREEFVDQMEYEFLDPDDNQATPHGRVAWEELRVEATRGIVNGDATSEIYANAREKLRKASTRSYVNAQERWNTGMNAIAVQLVQQYEENVHVITHSSGDEVTVGTPPDDDWEIVEAAQPESAGDNESILGKMPVDTPVPASELEGRDEDLFEIVIHMDGDWRPLFSEWTDYPSSSTNIDLVADTDDLQEITVLAGNNLFTDLLDTIIQAHEEIDSDVETYVDSLEAGIQQGAIDPADILGPVEIANQFEDSNEMTRLAQELVAIGGQVPDAAGYRATVSHDDLAADELEGLLFPQFDTDDPPSVNAGVTIDSTDYGLAYFGYESELSDEDGETEFITEVLSGESDLEIISVSGVEGQESVDGADDEAGADGRVVLWTGDDPPEPLAEPGDHDGWRVVVEGETTTDSQPVSNVEEDGDEIVLQTTALGDEEAVESVELVPPVEYERSHDYTADATDVDSEETLARLEQQRELIEDLEDALEDDDGAGWWPSAPSAPSVDDFGSQLAGIAVLALIVISVVWSVVSDAVPFLGN